MKTISDSENKILIVGNGFDIAHGLKTKYTDFLNFINEIKEKAHKMMCIFLPFFSCIR